MAKKKYKSKKSAPKKIKKIPGKKVVPKAVRKKIGKKSRVKEEVTSFPLNHSCLAIAFFLFLLSFFFYLLFLAPTVAPRDSAELTAVSYTMGIAHPPGYPLYTILGKIFTLIPLANIAFRVNLMSAFFASLTIFFIFLVILKLARNLVAAISSSFVFAFTSIFWSQSLVAEVFTLYAFFVALLFFILAIWRENKKNIIPLYIFFIICGLSLTHHQSMIFLLPAFFLFIWFTDKKVFYSYRNILIFLGLIVTGLLIYIYLPIRASQNPVMNWGDPKTFERFVNVILRIEYGTLVSREPAPPETFISYFYKIFYYFKSLIIQFTIPFFILGLLGIWNNIRKDLRLFYVMLTGFLLGGFLFFVLTFFLGAPMTEEALYIRGRLYIPASIIFTIWVGYGILMILEDGHKLLKNKFKSPILLKYYGLVLSLIILMITPLPFLLHFNIQNMNSHFYTQDLGSNLYHSLKPNSVIFSGPDTIIFTLRYMQNVENLRPDVKIINTTTRTWEAGEEKRSFPSLIKEKDMSKYPTGEAFLKDIVDFNITKYPLYTDFYLDDALKEFADRIAPTGLVYKIMPDKNEEAKMKQTSDSDFLWDEYSLRGKYNTREISDYPTEEIISFYALARRQEGFLFEWNKRLDIANKYYQEADKFKPGDKLDEINKHFYFALHYQQADKLDESINEYQEIIKLDSRNLSAHMALGNAYLNSFEMDKAIKEYEKALEISPEEKDVLLRLAETYYMMRNYKMGSEATLTEKGQDYVRRVLLIDPENKEAKQLQQAFEQPTQ